MGISYTTTTEQYIQKCVYAGPLRAPICVCNSVLGRTDPFPLAAPRRNGGISAEGTESCQHPGQSCSAQPASVLPHTPQQQEYPQGTTAAPKEEKSLLSGTASPRQRSLREARNKNRVVTINCRDLFGCAEPCQSHKARQGCCPKGPGTAFGLITTQAHTHKWAQS